MDTGARIDGANPPAPRSPGDEAAAWARFANARQAQEFCQSWLALQCRLVRAAAGLLLLDEGGASFAPAASWPPQGSNQGQDFAALVPIAERALRERRGLAERTAEGAALAAWPIETRERLAGVVVVDLGACDDAALQAVLRALHWGGGWLEALLLRRAAAEDAERVATARTALELVAAIGAARGLVGAATTLASEAALRLGCRRVAVGLLRRGQARLVALSHAADLAVRLRLAGGLANAMEEAIDQRATIAWPAPAGQHRVAIAHRDHVRDARIGSALTVPLAASGRIFGAVTLERDETSGFDAATIRLAEAVAEVAGPVLAIQREADRLIGGRVPRGLATGLRRVFGPAHPVWKLAAVVVLALALWLSFAGGEFRISGSAHLEGEVQQALVAPFDGFVATAAHRAGDVVQKGEVIATLDTRKLELDALRYQGEQTEALLKQRNEQGKHDIAAAEVEGARAAEAGAQLALQKEQIARARLVAPYAGVIVSGDLSQQLGSPVERGKVLFEVAPLDRYRVVLEVDEHDIRFIHPGQQASLVLNGLPRRPLVYTVARVVPVAVAEGGKNSFRVEGVLSADDARLRPGMEGIGKIEIGEARLIWIWSRPIIDWMRLFWWRWWP